MKDDLEIAIENHIKKFKKEPVIIGYYWADRLDAAEAIKKAIETNKPYNELDLLTKEEKEQFEKGNLLF